MTSPERPPVDLDYARSLATNCGLARRAIILEMAAEIEHQRANVTDLQAGVVDINGVILDMQRELDNAVLIADPHATDWTVNVLGPDDVHLLKTRSEVIDLVMDIVDSLSVPAKEFDPSIILVVIPPRTPAEST